MALPHPDIWTQARYTAVAVILVALLLPTALTKSVSADDQDETNQAIARGFDVLQTEIERIEGLPPGPKTSLLAKADAAETVLIALLLPAVQSARETARNDVVVIPILIALQQENQILSARFGYDGGAIDEQAERIKRYVLENAWPTS